MSIPHVSTTAAASRATGANARLMLLGLLADGPKHGHLVRRIAELSNVQEWASIQPGALYGLLHRLAGEGLVSEVRTEKVGRRPARTVYAITHQGRLELATLRERALAEIGLGSSAIDVVLTFGVPDADTLRDLLAVRRKRVELLLDETVAHRGRDTKAGHLSPSDVAVFRHWEHRLRAEIAWHDEIEPDIDEIAAGGSLRDLCAQLMAEEREATVLTETTTEGDPA